MKTARPAALAVISVFLALGSARPSAWETKTREIPVSPGGLLTIELEGGGDLEVLGADVAAARVEYSVRDDEADNYDIAVKPAKGGLEIRAELKRRADSLHGVDFKITLPKKFDVSLDSMGGGLTIESLERTFSGKTMGGGIDVDDAPEGAKVHTMGGPLRIVNARKFVEAKTMGGDIRIMVRDGWVDAVTMGGDITVDVAGGLGADDKGIRLESMSGDVELTVPAGLPLRFDLTIAYTRNSDQDYQIVSDFPLKEERTQEWDHGRGTARKYIYGKGSAGAGTFPVRIETVNGDITIRKAR
jgi:hypothetical protein